MTGIFIVGAPRSGTTLLQSMLASHSCFYSAPETSFFYRIIPLLGVKFSNPDQELDEQAVEKIKEDLNVMVGLDECVLGALLPGFTMKQAFEQILKSKVGINKRQWIEKTTNHAQCMILIRRFYPEAKFIHLIRDPIESVSSMLNVRPAATGDFRISFLPSIIGHARIWRHCVSSALAFPGQDSVCHVFYEDMIRSPVVTLKRICKFLGVAYEAKMLSDFHITARDLFSAKHSPWQAENLVPGVRREKVNHWREKNSAARNWLIQKATYRLGLSLGYCDNSQGISLHQKLGVLILDLTKLLLARSKLEWLLRKGLLILKKASNVVTSPNKRISHD